MKIVHITTYDHGGAGNAAIRLHLALLEIGCDSSILFMRRSKLHDIPNSSFLEDSPELSLYESKVELAQIKAMDFMNETKLDCELATFHYGNYDCLQHPLVQSANIVNLHWIGYMFDYETFFSQINKPVVWTLHDTNPFSGLFHYIDDEEKNATLFGEVDREEQAIKCSAIAKASNLTVVSPSKWLADLSSKSETLKGREHYTIYNTVNFPDYIASYQEPYQPKNSLKLLFVAANTDNYRKGFDLLLGAMRQIKPSHNISLIVVGEGSTSDDPNIKYLGKIDSAEQIASLYMEVDALVLPSREDNLPNTMLEALICGTPVIGFKIGGIPEIITNGANGVLVDEVTSSSLAGVILQFFKEVNEFNSEAIQLFARNKFKTKSIAEKYCSIYSKSLLRKKLPALTPSTETEKRIRQFEMEVLSLIYKSVNSLRRLLSGNYSIYGTGGKAREIQAAVEQCGLKQPLFFIDKDSSEKSICGIKVVDVRETAGDRLGDAIILGSPVYQREMKIKINRYLPDYSGEIFDMFSQRHNSYERKELDDKLYFFCGKYQALIKVLSW